MLTALAAEIQLRSINWLAKDISTIYFGGGTPSLLSGEEISTLIETIRSRFRVDEKAEITLECNPDDCSEANLAAWKMAGVNRLSIGIQSFEDEQLEWMNRTHSAEEGRNAVLLAKAAGFEALTIDLMYGLPGLTDEQWKQQLQRAIALGVDHISAYCLTVEEKTPLAGWVKQGKVRPADPDVQSVQFELLVSELATAGFEHYEISNFARNERYSRHNTSYWQGKSYLGIGPSAHGYDGTIRYWNQSNNHAYMRSIEQGILPETIETLSPNDRFNELLLTGLRTKWGVSKNELERTLKITSDWQKRLQHWKSEGYLIEMEDAFLLTENGKLLADAIASDLFVVD